MNVRELKLGLLGWALWAGMSWQVALGAAGALEPASPVRGDTPAAQATLSIVDGRGQRVTLAQPPQRIVSTLPSLTETVCALGACERLVGVDRYSNWPAAVRALPQVGGGLDPSVEAIVALKPDLVLLPLSSRVTERLQTLGLTVAVLEPQTHAQARQSLQAVGQLLGLPPAVAQQTWQRIEQALQRAADRVPHAARGARVYVEVNSGPYAASPSSFIGETLTRLHASNIVGPEHGPFPKISPEYVVRANPALIMIGLRSAQGLEQRPGWQRVAAIANGHVCRWTAEQADVVVRAGPRLDEAAHLMAACLSRLANSDMAPVTTRTSQTGAAP